MKTGILLIAFALFVLWVWLTWKDRTIKMVLFLLLPFGMSAQEGFYLNCDFYITTSGSDSTHYEKASIYMDSSEFFLIRGQDTTVRRLCNYNPYYSELSLSCGDWVRPVRDWNGKVYGLWYREDENTYYFNSQFIRRNLLPKE